MHEAALAEGLLKLVQDSVRDYDAANPGVAGRVKELKLGLGLLSCIEIQTFTSCFELLAEGTEAEGAKVTVEVEPLPCRCQSCGEAFSLTKRAFLCPKCQSTQLSFSGGHGLVLLSLDVEKKDVCHA